MAEHEHNIHPSKVWGDELDWDNAIIPLMLAEAEAYHLLEHFDSTLKCFRGGEYSATRTVVERLRERLTGIIDPGRAAIDHQALPEPQELLEGLPTSQDDATRTEAPKQEQEAGDTQTGQTSSSDQEAT